MIEKTRRRSVSDWVLKELSDSRHTDTCGKLASPQWRQLVRRGESELADPGGDGEDGVVESKVDAGCTLIVLLAPYGFRGP